MSLGLSVFLVVLGATLRYALTWRTAGMDLPVLGLILIVTGIVTSVICILRVFLSSTARESARASRAWPTSAAFPLRQDPAAYDQPDPIYAQPDPACAQQDPSAQKDPAHAQQDGACAQADPPYGRQSPPCDRPDPPNGRGNRPGLPYRALEQQAFGDDPPTTPSPTGLPNY